MMQQQSSWMTPVLAFCLSFLFSLTLAPTLGLVAYQQYDFLILWLVTMLLLALPALYMEIGLAKRTQSSPLQGLMKLTRDADRSTRWRSVGWLAIITVPLIAGAVLYFAQGTLTPHLDMAINPSIIMLILAIVAVAISMLPRLILISIATIATLAFIGLGLMAGHGTWQWTAISFAEWGKVVALTLVTGGLGLGLYWQSVAQHAQEKSSSTPIVLPIWIAQALGLLAMLWVNQTMTITQAISLLIATLAISGFILQAVRDQLIHRQIALPIQALIMLLPLLVWALPISTILYPVLIAIGLVLCLAYSIFAGWLMKISHLRKSLNFSSEATYNIWRIFVRIVMPISIVVALIAWLQALILN